MYWTNRPKPITFTLLITLLITGLLLPGGCSDADQEHKETVYVFGTLVDFTIKGVDEDQARQAVSAVDREFRRMHKDWHAWKPGELSRLNAAFSAGKSTKVSPFLLPLIRQAKTLYIQSDGLFNAGIGSLIGAWGFHADEMPKGAIPPLEKIRALAIRKPSMENVVIEGEMVHSTNPVVHLDFGGFAKGVALDRAVDILRRNGVENAIVNAGGDMNTLGNAGGSAGDRPWKVGIRHPVNWGVIASVRLRDDENIYTSGNYQRFREHEGVRYAHIIDPRDGMPVRHIVSASVIHENGATADAAATAITVAGPAAWHRIAKKMRIKFALLVDEQGTIYVNPAMKARVEFAKDGPKKLVLSPPL